MKLTVETTMILTVKTQPNVAEQLIKNLADPQPGTQASIKPSAKALTQRKDRRQGKDEWLDQATKEQVVVDVEQPAVHVDQLGGFAFYSCIGFYGFLGYWFG
jgi:hypothetical protein